VRSPLGERLHRALAHFRPRMMCAVAVDERPVGRVQHLVQLIHVCGASELERGLGDLVVQALQLGADDERTWIGDGKKSERTRKDEVHDDLRSSVPSSNLRRERVRNYTCNGSAGGFVRSSGVFVAESSASCKQVEWKWSGNVHTLQRFA